MKILTGKTVAIAEKVALFDRKIWPKATYDEELPEQHRFMGNFFYNVHNFQGAIYHYNKALLLLTKSVEKMGIAYSNRSAAYLALQCYSDCLDSARLAKECPLQNNVLKKVLARERMSIEKSEYASSEESVKFSEPIELSYRRHKRITSFVHCLSLKDHRNPFGGIVTTKNILPGDVLVVEKPLATWTDAMCGYCLRVTGSLQPCKCNGVMFCSTKCKEDAFATFHQFECPIMDHLLCFPSYDRLAQRIFFKLIHRFKDVHGLRDYLQNIKNPNPFDFKDAENLPNMDSFESQFRIYFATKHVSVVNTTVHKPLSSGFENSIVTKSLAKTAITIDLLKTCKGLPHIANTEEEWSYLSEQLFLIFCYIPLTFRQSNQFEISYVQNANEGIQMQLIPTQPNIGGLYGTASLFRSTCRENIVMDFVNGVLVVRALKFIPRNTELLCSMR